MAKIKSRSMMAKELAPKPAPVDYHAIEQKRIALAFKAVERGIEYIEKQFGRDGLLRIHAHVWVQSNTDCPLALASGSGDYAKTALEHNLSEHRSGTLGFLSTDHYTMYDLSCVWQHFVKEGNLT